MRDALDMNCSRHLDGIWMESGIMGGYGRD